MNTVYIVFEKYKSPVGHYPHDTLCVDSVFANSDDADMRIVQASQKLKDKRDTTSSYFQQRWEVLNFNDIMCNCKTKEN